MMSSGMIDSLIVYGPIIVLIVACIGIVWSVLKKRRYLIGYIFLLVGAGIYYWGMYVGKWEGIAISLFWGGGMVLLGLLTLLFILVYTKLVITKRTKTEVK
ncbi:hypothetical protein [Planococcus alpniumensis]|uniref:hypothetical protein n=1 Tax=Planococcus alpniumensis TaxID=2708345 RepID=UPI001B8D1A94|nr:hypothetical protein [Planococcus sp. MSAK28401]